MKRLGKWIFIVGISNMITFNFLGIETKAQQIFPAKDITLICQARPGGGFDISARGIAPFLTKYLKEVSPGAKGGEVKVKNMAEAGGARAAVYMYNEAKPDGYTVGTFNVGSLYKFLYGSEKLPYDIRKYTWLFSAGGELDRFLISNKKRFATWEEMVASSKKEPLTFVSINVGSSEHLESIFLKELVGLPGKFTFSGGTAMSVSAVLRGECDIAMISYDSAKAIIDSKEVNVLVTFTEKRLLPQVPTIKEKGFPNLLKYIGGKTNRVIIAPPNLVPESKRIIIAAARKMTVDPEYRAFCEKIGTKLDFIFDEELKEEIMERTELLLQMAPILQKYGI